MLLHNVQRAEAGGRPIAGDLGTCRQERTNSSHLFMSQELKDRARHHENTQGESLWCKISLLLPQRHTGLSCPRGFASSPACYCWAGGSFAGGIPIKSSFTSRSGLLHEAYGWGRRHFWTCWVPQRSCHRPIAEIMLEKELLLLGSKNNLVLLLC